MENKDKSVKESDNFSFTVKAGERDFIFSGPKSASIGMIYDVVHRLLLEVTNIAQKKANDLAIKEPEKETKEVVKDLADKK